MILVFSYQAQRIYFVLIMQVISAQQQITHISSYLLNKSGNYLLGSYLRLLHFAFHTWPDKGLVVHCRTKVQRQSPKPRLCHARHGNLHAPSTCVTPHLGCGASLLQPFRIRIQHNFQQLTLKKSNIMLVAKYKSVLI